jgi:hypothetical protein
MRCILMGLVFLLAISCSGARTSRIAKSAKAINSTNNMIALMQPYPELITLRDPIDYNILQYKNEVQSEALSIYRQQAVDALAGLYALFRKYELTDRDIRNMTVFYSSIDFKLVAENSDGYILRILDKEVTVSKNSYSVDWGPIPDSPRGDIGLNENLLIRARLLALFRETRYEVQRLRMKGEVPDNIYQILHWYYENNPTAHIATLIVTGKSMAIGQPLIIDRGAGVDTAMLR